jgi:hypothetical protein
VLLSGETDRSRTDIVLRCAVSSPIMENQTITREFDSPDHAVLSARRSDRSVMPGLMQNHAEVQIFDDC